MNKRWEKIKNVFTVLCLVLAHSQLKNVHLKEIVWCLLKLTAKQTFHEAIIIPNVLVPRFLLRSVKKSVQLLEMNSWKTSLSTQKWYFFVPAVICCSVALALNSIRSVYLQCTHKKTLTKTKIGEIFRTLIFTAQLNTRDGFSNRISIVFKVFLKKKFTKIFMDVIADFALVDHYPIFSAV